MFSGIVEGMAKILHRDGGHFVVENIFNESLVLGQSIAHDGACMTVTDIQDYSYSFFVMEESLSKTQLGEKKIGDYFNVERSLQFGQRVDGHMVTGHIDTTAQVNIVEKNNDESWNLTLLLPVEFGEYILTKGSITINGVSLTIVSKDIKDDKNIEVKVCLIPYTHAHTNLGVLQKGDKVNIECDMMGKYIVATVKNLSI